MQHLTHQARCYLQSLADNDGLANRAINIAALNLFDASLADSLTLFSEMCGGLLARGLIQKVCGEFAHLTAAGRRELECHPFDEPCSFGEDGEWYAVRRDISREEAARRITEFDDKSTGEKREPFQAKDLGEALCVYLPDCGDGSEG